MSILNSNNPTLTSMWQLSPEHAMRVVAKAMKETGGDVTRTAEKLSVARRTIDRWVLKNPFLQRTLEQARSDRRVSVAERRAARRRTA